MLMIQPAFAVDGAMDALNGPLKAISRARVPVCRELVRLGGIEWLVQGHFTAPAKPLRAEHRRPTPNGDLHGQFRPSDGEPSHSR